MAQRTPPPQIPVIKFDSPNKTDLGLVEYWNSEVATYTPLDIGAPYPNPRVYQGYKLGIQAPVEGDEKWIRRVWVTDNTNQDWFNYQLKYVEEAAGFPIYIRQYQELKSTYTERARLTPLQTVYKLRITLSGSGYDPSIKELSLTFSGGGGTGAAGRALINFDGTICQLVIDNEGSGYTSSPTFTIPPPSAGVTATGLAFIQSVGAYLVREDATLYPEDSENYALYFNVLRIYQTLPGPWIFDGLFRDPGIQVDKESKALVVHKKRVNIPDNILASAVIYTGASGAITAALTGQSVTSATVSVAGTAYAEFVNLVFGASPTGRTASGYAKTTAGAITSVIITDPGTGYNAGAPTVTVLPSALVSTERKDIDTNTAYEVVEITAQSPYYSAATALVAEVTEGIERPGLCDYAAVAGAIGGGQGIINLSGRSLRATNIPVSLLTYYVISDTKPTVAWDSIEPTDVYFARSVDGATIVVGSLSNMLHNAYSLPLTSGTISFPASDPSYTTYIAWIAAGTPKNIKGSIIPVSFAKLWKVEIYYVIPK